MVCKTNNNKRIKDMLKELVRLGPSGDYATRSCCLNRACNLLAEIDGMEIVGWRHQVDKWLTKKT